MVKTPVQDFIEFFGFGYEEFIFSQLTPKQIQKYCQNYAESLIEKERKVIREAFLYGYECSGKCDNPDVLADLYYSIKYERNKDE